MRMRRTDIVGVLVPTVRLSFYTNAIDVLEKKAQARGCQCVLVQTHSRADALEAQVQALRERQVDGLIIYPAGSSVHERLYRELLHDGVPFVVCDEQPVKPKVPAVRTDDHAIGRLATGHLLELGHVRIGCISGPADTATGRDRLEGYRAALRAAKVPERSELVAIGTYAPEEGARAVRRWLDSGVEFTAVFAENDAIAASAMAELAQRGLRVPADVSVVGSANLDFGSLLTPALTTVDQRTEQVAAIAAELLFRQIDDARSTKDRGLVVIEPRLIVRSSTQALQRQRGRRRRRAP